MTRAVRCRELWAFIGINFRSHARQTRNKVCYVAPSRSDGEERCFSARFTGDAYKPQDRPVTTGPESPTAIGSAAQRAVVVKRKSFGRRTVRSQNLKTNSQNTPKIIFRSDVLDEKDQNGPTLATSSGQLDQKKARPRRTAS